MRHLLKSAAAKGFLLTALLLFAASICRAQSVAPETPDYILRSGGMERTYKLHLPAGLPENAPLVVVLHGYGGNNNPDRFAMNATADRHGFAVCYPQGAKDGRGKSCWNVGYPFQADMTVDDVRFLTELVRHLQKKHGLSRHNVFCTGMSNGGEMCYQLAAQRPRLFAGGAVVKAKAFQTLAVHRQRLLVDVTFQHQQTQYQLVNVLFLHLRKLGNLPGAVHIHLQLFHGGIQLAEGNVS